MNMRNSKHIKSATTITPYTFQKRLLKWFFCHGRTHLPWQQHKTPYRVWVSEIMLQQTQVNTVIPYFERFMRAFPTVDELAMADEDNVMQLWAGLGYYSRARNLHKAAKIVMKTFAGQLPNTLHQLVSLPGIGESTAAAILSLAFQKQATILDGNVKRVLARFHGIETPIDEPQTLKKLWQLARHYTPKNTKQNRRDDIANYTQAMMDLGATLCTRKNPKCYCCPLKNNCIARENNKTDTIPRKKSARKIPIRQRTFIIIKNQNSILLQKRPPRGIWGGLWSFPEMEGKPNHQKLTGFCYDNFNMQLVKHRYQLLPSFRHTFTHYHLDIFPLLVEMKRAPRKIMAGLTQIWYNFDEDIALGLPKPVQTLISTFVPGKP